MNDVVLLSVTVLPGVKNIVRTHKSSAPKSQNDNTRSAVFVIR